MSDGSSTGTGAGTGPFALVAAGKSRSKIFDLRFKGLFSLYCMSRGVLH